MPVYGVIWAKTFNADAILKAFVQRKHGAWSKELRARSSRRSDVSEASGLRSGWFDRKRNFMISALEAPWPMALRISLL
jgi:hypothetical protein